MAANKILPFLDRGSMAAEAENIRKYCRINAPGEQVEIFTAKLTILCHDLLRPIAHISGEDGQLAAIPKTLK